MLNRKKTINNVASFIMGGILAVSLIYSSIPLRATATPTNVNITNTTSNEQVNETDQIIVSTVIPITEENTLNEEVLEEVRSQETLEAKITQEVKERKRQKAIAARKKYINNIVCDPSDVSKVSGLKEKDYKYLTKGTWWEGNEHTLMDLENNYGVNAMFAMSVSTLESYFGRSDRAKSRNNYYGLELSRSWDSLYSNTQTWGKIIREYYIKQGRISTTGISTKYCPPNSEYWAEFNRNNMYKLYNKLISRMNDTLN